jgi:hypothetical protein
MLHNCNVSAVPLNWDSVPHPSRFVVRHGWIDSIR